MKSSYDLVRDIVGRANEVPLIVCGREVSACWILVQWSALWQ